MRDKNEPLSRRDKMALGILQSTIIAQSNGKRRVNKIEMTESAVKHADLLVATLDK